MPTAAGVVTRTDMQSTHLSPSTESPFLLPVTFSLDRAISSDESEQIFLIAGTSVAHDDARFKLISTSDKHSAQRIIKYTKFYSSLLRAKSTVQLFLLWSPLQPKIASLHQFQIFWDPMYTREWLIHSLKQMSDVGLLKLADVDVYEALRNRGVA